MLFYFKKKMNATQRLHFYNESDIFNLKPPKNINNYQKENNKKTQITRIEKNKNLRQEIMLTPLKQHRYKNNIDHFDYLKTQKSPFENLNKTFIKSSKKKIIIDDKDEERKEDYLKIKEKNVKNNIKFGDDITSFKTTNNINEEIIQKRFIKKKKEEELKPKKKEENEKIYKKIKPKPLTQKNTANSKFDEFSSRKTGLQYYKSNIFNDPKKEIFNQTFQPKISRKENKKEIKKKPILKKEKNIEPLLPKKIEWCNTEKFIKKDYSNINITAKERKLLNNKGSFPSKYSDYKSIRNNKENDLNKSMDTLMVKKHEKYIGITENEREEDNFEINNINQTSKFNMNEVKKEFRNNGFHIYGDKVNIEFFNGKERGQAKFSIRKDINDKDYDFKIKKVESILEKQQGIKISHIKDKSIDNVLYKKKSENNKGKCNWMKMKIYNLKVDKEKKEKEKDKNK